MGSEPANVHGDFFYVSFSEEGNVVFDVTLPADGSRNFEIDRESEGVLLVEVAGDGKLLTVEQLKADEPVRLNGQLLKGRTPLRDGDRLELLGQTLQVAWHRKEKEEKLLPENGITTGGGHGESGHSGGEGTRWLVVAAAIAGLTGALGVWFFGFWPQLNRNEQDTAAAPQSVETASSSATPKPKISLRGASPDILPPQPGRQPWSGELWRSDLGSPVGCVDISADGLVAVAGTADGKVHLFDPETGTVSATLELHADSIASLALSADGSRLLVGSYDGNASLWDVATRKPLMNLGAHTSPVRAVAISPDGRRGLTADSEGLVIYWDLDSGEDLLLLLGHTQVVNSVAFSPDGKRAATGGIDRHVLVWDLATGSRVIDCTMPTGVNDVAYAPDGLSLAVAMDGFLPEPDGIRLIEEPTLLLLDAETGKPLDRLTYTGEWMISLAFSPVGHLLAGTSGGNPDPRINGPKSPCLLQLWDTRTGMRVKHFDRHTALVSGVVFLPGGRSAITSSLDHTIRRW